MSEGGHTIGGGYFDSENTFFTHENVTKEDSKFPTLDIDLFGHKKDYEQEPVYFVENLESGFGKDDSEDLPQEEKPDETFVNGKDHLVAPGDQEHTLIAKTKTTDEDMVAFVCQSIVPEKSVELQGYRKTFYFFSVEPQGLGNKKENKVTLIKANQAAELIQKEDLQGKIAVLPVKKNSEYLKKVQSIRVFFGRGELKKLKTETDEVLAQDIDDEYKRAEILAKFFGRDNEVYQEWNMEQYRALLNYPELLKKYLSPAKISFFLHRMKDISMEESSKLFQEYSSNQGKKSKKIPWLMQQNLTAVITFIDNLLVKNNKIDQFAEGNDFVQIIKELIDPDEVHEVLSDFLFQILKIFNIEEKDQMIEQILKARSVKDCANRFKSCPDKKTYFKLLKEVLREVRTQIYPESAKINKRLDENNGKKSTSTKDNYICFVSVHQENEALQTPPEVSVVTERRLSMTLSSTIDHDDVLSTDNDYQISLTPVSSEFSEELAAHENL